MATSSSCGAGASESRLVAVPAAATAAAVPSDPLPATAAPACERASADAPAVAAWMSCAICRDSHSARRPAVTRCMRSVGNHIRYLDGRSLYRPACVQGTTKQAPYHVAASIITRVACTTTAAPLAAVRGAGETHQSRRNPARACARGTAPQYYDQSSAAGWTQAAARWTRARCRMRQPPGRWTAVPSPRHCRLHQRTAVSREGAKSGHQRS